MVRGMALVLHSGMQEMRWRERGHQMAQSSGLRAHFAVSQVPAAVAPAVACATSAQLVGFDHQSSEEPNRHSQPPRRGIKSGLGPQIPSRMFSMKWHSRAGVAQTERRIPSQELFRSACQSPSPSGFRAAALTDHILVPHDTSERRHGQRSYRMDLVDQGIPIGDLDSAPSALCSNCSFDYRRIRIEVALGHVNLVVWEYSKHFGVGNQP